MNEYELKSMFKEVSIYLTPNQMELYLLIESYGRMTVKEIFSLTRFTQRVIYQNLRYLMQKGKIERELISDEMRYFVRTS